MDVTKAIEELEKNRPKICKWENYDNPDRRRFIGVFPDHETAFGRALDAVIKAVKKGLVDIEQNQTVIQGDQK